MLHLFGRQLPLYMVIYDSALFAIVALLCVRDDNGRPAIVATLADRLPTVGAQITTARLLAIATAVLMSAVLLPIAVFSLLRIGGDPKPAYDLLALSDREGLRPIRRPRAGRQTRTVLPVI